MLASWKTLHNVGHPSPHTPPWRECIKTPIYSPSSGTFPSSLSLPPLFFLPPFPSKNRWRNTVCTRYREILQGTNICGSHEIFSVDVKGGTLKVLIHLAGKKKMGLWLWWEVLWIIFCSSFVWGWSLHHGCRCCVIGRLQVGSIVGSVYGSHYVTCLWWWR